jgi:hypothetical protein
VPLMIWSRRIGPIRLPRPSLPHLRRS